MKNNIILKSGVSLLSLAALAHAGSLPPLDIIPAAMPTVSTPDFMSKIKLTGDTRARYEFREQSNFDASHALTTRLRLGVEVGDFNGFSAFAEGEASRALVDDYRSNPTGSNSTTPYVVGNTPIGDPETLELNRAWIQYKKNGYLAKVGRQRIIRNNAAFIGNVGWRQNEQTYDAAQLGYAKDGFSLNYAYSNRVQRIFGNDANDALPGPPLHDFEGDFHFIDANFKTNFGDVGTYAYLIDVDNNSSVGESNTFGAFLKKDGLHLELAGQTGTSTRGAVGDYDALYGHLIYTKKVGAGSFTAGVEYLGSDFKTPFATVHAFNGFADAFILNRIGLSNSFGSYEGLTDVYAGYTQKGLPGGLLFKGFVHYFMDDSLSKSYGYEADAVLVKAFSPSLKGIMKAAYFKAEEANYHDIKQVSIEINHSF